MIQNSQRPSLLARMKEPIFETPEGWPSRLRPPSPSTLIVVAIALIVGLVAMSFAGRAIDPLDGLLTRRQCAVIGDEVYRPVEEVDVARRFALFGRTDGSCLYGPVDVELQTEKTEELSAEELDAIELSAGAQLLAAADPTAEVRLTIPQLEPDGFYRAGKWMGFLLRLGAGSFAIRLVAPPLFERFIPRRR
ncbi:MAG: hypothetical protein AAGD35_20760 [Actinomycetota bacterium]